MFRLCLMSCSIQDVDESAVTRSVMLRNFNQSIVLKVFAQTLNF